MVQQTTALTRSDLAGPDGFNKLASRNNAPVVPMGERRGGVRFNDMVEVMEFAKLMAVADIGVPKHFRGNPGLCLRVCVQADAWGFDPFAVADKAYEVNNRIAYESQLVHAVVERHAPLEGRLRPSWEGKLEDGTRRCVVTGQLVGEPEPFVWKGPMIKDIKVKNSPEWGANPDKQLWYHASRDWARIFVPDVLLGVYSRDELDQPYAGPSNARPVDSIASRLPEPEEGRPGFDAQGIARTLGSPVPQDQPEPDPQPQEQVTEQVAEAQEEAPKTTGSKRAGSRKASQKAPQPAAETENTAPADNQGDSLPRTAEDYVSYAENWIIACTTAKQFRERWKNEKAMRDELKVSLAQSSALNRKAAHLE